MGKVITYIKQIGICLGILGLVGCELISPSIIEKPNAPPKINRTLFHGPTSKENVLSYQYAIINYIKYLEQYYITIGVYYGGNINLPNRSIEDQCKVIEQIFKDIDLPKPPISHSKEVEKTFNLLIDHIAELRRLIRKNNAYMETLRLKYKNCK